MMKKMLCLLLVLLLCPMLVCAEDHAAEMLTYQELLSWTQVYINRAYQTEPLNNPAESLTTDGYQYIYNFGTLYADTPILSPDTVVSAVVLTSEEEKGLRNVNVNSSLYAVLDAYYSENEELRGSRDSAVIYAMDQMPVSAGWAQALRDGQRVQTVQYAVHDQIDEGYTDAGVIYTMVNNRVNSIRVYGLDSRATREQVNDVMTSLLFSDMENDYVQMRTSENGAELDKFGAKDMLFSGMDFLTLTPDQAISLLGEPVSDLWMDNGKDSFLRMQVFDECELTYLFNKERTQGYACMLQITGSKMEGPRAVRCGDSYDSVYSRFRNGEGVIENLEQETLYSEDAQGNYGKATYGTDASANLRYGFMSGDGRQIELQMNFTLMELTEILLYIK